MNSILQFVAVASFVLVHLFASKLRFLNVVPRSRWLSTAGGISVAYVFVHVFPELAAAQERIGENGQLLTMLDHHVYLLALVGLALFYGLERAVKTSQREGDRQAGEDAGEITTESGIFWIHIGSFAVYNGLIGYLLVHREEQDLRGLLFFTGALALHFLVNDNALRQTHKATYRHYGRWILAAAILAGWLIGLATQVDRRATDALFALLAGGVVLNVLKEELPDERQSRFLPFALGAAAYATMLVLL